MDLSEIEARLNAITPGTWMVAERTANVMVATESDPIIWWAETGRYSGDAEFIAHAPEDIAALIVRVHELESQQLESLAKAWDEGRSDSIEIYGDGYATYSMRVIEAVNPYRALMGGE